MNQKLLLAVLLGFIAISTGCGKNGSRTSGQQSGVEAVGLPGERTVKRVSLAEPLEIPGYVVLGAFEASALPAELSAADSLSTIGTVDFYIESQSYSAFYQGTSVKPTVSARWESQPIPVYLIRNSQLGNRMILAIEANDFNRSKLNKSENIQVQSEPVMRISEINMPTRMQDSIIQQVVTCDRNEQCIVCHWVCPNNPESKEAHDVLRDYNASVRSRTPVFLKSQILQNTETATQFRVSLKGAFTGSGVSTLVFER